MCIEGAKGALPRSNHGGRKSGDGRRQSRKCVEMANTIVCVRCQEIPGASKLLQAFCEGLCQSSTTNESIDKEG